MPAFLKTPADEAAWTKAKARAKEQGHEENWPYITAIWKTMTGKTASASRVADLYLQSYNEKGRDPEKGWEHGEVEPFKSGPGIGSQAPPAHGHQGEPVEVPDLGAVIAPGVNTRAKNA